VGQADALVDRLNAVILWAGVLAFATIVIAAGLAVWLHYHYDIAPRQRRMIIALTFVAGALSCAAGVVIGQR